jgi:hypothetical protein
MRLVKTLEFLTHRLWRWALNADSEADFSSVIRQMEKFSGATVSSQLGSLRPKQSPHGTSFAAILYMPAGHGPAAPCRGLDPHCH